MENDKMEFDVFSCLYLIKALAKLGHRSLAESMIVKIPQNILHNECLMTPLIDIWVRTI
mgnify:FL=1